MADNMTGGSPSGFTEAEAREFHALYVQGFIGFTAIALVAHLLVYMWRPWPAPAKAAELIDGVNAVLHALV